MIAFFANIFGYILNFLYETLNDYGLAIILFSVILKLVLIPMSIKQQKSLKKTTQLQEEMKKIQEKYGDNPEKKNQETIELYKREKMSPFSGCLTAIIQIILLFAMFYLVRSPLTYMKKVEPQLIEKYTTEIKEENPEENKSYPEISIIRKASEKLKTEEITDEEKAEYEKVYINMESLGLDLSSVPTQDLSNPKSFIIPILYVISSFISIKITSNINNNKKEEKAKKEPSELDAVANANKSMMWFMPIMSISIALVAPLGLALYWLVNNVLMIIERLVMNKFIDPREEVENGK